MCDGLCVDEVWLSPNVHEYVGEPEQLTDSTLPWNETGCPAVPVAGTFE